MPDLKFEIISSEVKPFAAMPTLSFKLQITNTVEHEEVYAAALKCQVMIEAIKRTYNEEAKDKLYELFGEPMRWDETLKSFFWTIVNIPVPRFTGTTTVEVAIPCSEDQALAAGKYFHAVSDGHVPLAFLFSGTLFYKDINGNLQVSLIPWEKEATHKMPAYLWQEMMDIYFPDSRWLRVKKDTYDRLVTYKSKSVFPTLETAFESLVDKALQGVELTEKHSA
ncbi:hypothetical protein FW778_13545 [Ginsengibacter hankyongi]|uniref:Uncharacterized protein n=1 Tax=Ginsengibacter hankyongi TaxID=2607284 RepID=A0A5J5IIK5_9BACT|nr:DUF6084 family protein [Ginsengibacter hankyongi]KAA9038577.1 hypothetical protein FW778_13545 [Ginsengibacter hankyongi]